MGIIEEFFYDAPVAGSQVVIDTSVGDTSSSTNTQTFSFTCTGTNLVLLVIVQSYSAVGKVTGITYNTVALTKIGDGSYDPQGENLTYWGLIAPASGAPHNIVITYAGTVGNHLATAISFTNANQTTPFSNFNSNHGTNSSPTVTALSSAGDLVISSSHDFGGTAHTNMGLGQTTLTTALSNAAVTAIQIGNTGGNPLWNLSTNDNWVTGVLAIKPTQPNTITRAQYLMQNNPLINTTYNFPGACIAGNLLVAVVTTGGTHTIATGINDNLSNTWVPLTTYSVTPNSTANCQTKVFYCLRCNAGTPNIQITGGDDANNLLGLLEYHNLPNHALDVNAGTTAPAPTTLTPTSSSFVVSANSVVIATYNNQTDGWTTGVPLVLMGSQYENLLAQEGGQQYIVEDWLNADPQTTTAMFDLSVTDDPLTNAWTTYVVSFK